MKEKYDGVFEGKKGAREKEEEDMKNRRKKKGNGRGRFLLFRTF